MAVQTSTYVGDTFYDANGQPAGTRSPYTYNGMDFYKTSGGQYAYDTGFNTLFLNPNTLAVSDSSGANLGSATSRVSSTTSTPTAPTYSAPNPLVSAITNAYDNQVKGLQDFLGPEGTLFKNKQSAAQQVNNLYNTSNTNLEGSYNRGIENLDYQQDKVNNTRVSSLRDLAEAIRGSQQAFMNRLGTMGAGVSSASDLGQYAFAKLGAQGVTDINGQVADAQAQIGLRAGDLESEFMAQQSELQSWKDNQMLSIADQFRTQKQQILSDIRTTQAQKAIALAELNQSAVSALTDLDAYGKNLTYNTPQAPTVNSQAATNAANLSVAPIANNYQLVNNTPLTPRLQGGTPMVQGTTPYLQGGRRDDFQNAGGIQLQGSI